MIFDGQSLNVTPLPPDLPFPNRVMESHEGMPWWNVAISGTSWTVLSTTAATRLHPKFVGSTPNVLVLLGGQSDIMDGDSAATVLADMVAYADAARTAGADHIVACTLPPAALLTAPQDVVRLAVNDLILESEDFDSVADVAVIPELQDTGDLTYFYDGSHWTAVGADLAAAVVAPVVDAAIESVA